MKRNAVVLLLAIIVLLAVMILTPLIGSTTIDYRKALDGVSPDKEILFYARLPRVLLALLAGGALAVTGVLFQALVRDALADPYVLGVASGASLGAVLAICFGWRGLGGVSALWISASIGAAVTLFVVMAIATQGRRMSSFTLLLAGVTINSICAAVILFLHNVSSFTQSFAVLRWLMGNIEPVAYSTLALLAVLVLCLVVYVYTRALDWNLLAVGGDWAAARGASTSRLMLIGFVTGSLLTGTITALTGPHRLPGPDRAARPAHPLRSGPPVADTGFLSGRRLLSCHLRHTGENGDASNRDSRGCDYRDAGGTFLHLAAAVEAEKLVDVMRLFLGALQFMTIVPVKCRTVEPWRAAALFPLIGALLGAAGAGLLLVLEPHFSVQVRSLLVIAFWIAVTGAFHEDGLADVADGCRAERPREQILAIMKDSRVGTFGAVALIVTIALRWQGLASLTIEPLPALVAVMTLSRSAIVFLARVSRPGSEGMGAAFAGEITTAVALIALAQGMAAAWWCGPRVALAMIGVTGFVVLLARVYFHRRIGGVTGDCLGATSQITETVLLVLLACGGCGW